MPWDHAAGSRLISEAGGIARRLDGSPYRAADKPFSSPLVVACGEDQWNWLKSGIFDRSEEHTSELQSLMRISYAVFCLKKKKKDIIIIDIHSNSYTYTYHINCNNYHR